MFGGGLIQFAESAFDIDTRNVVALLATGVHVEKCGRLIIAPEPVTGVATHIALLDSLRWGSKSDELAAGGEIVNYSGGTLIIRGCWFGTGTPELTQYSFCYSTTQPEGVLIFEDCRVPAANDTGFFPGGPPTSVRGTLLYIANSDTPVPMPTT